MDRVTKEQRSRNMRCIKAFGTAPELKIRRLVCELGFRYRYRLHDHRLPGRPDLVFPTLRKLLFVHGCYWHAHGCKMSHMPKSNQDYWHPKLQRNQERDANNQRVLRDLGWQSLVLWECELADEAKLERRVNTFLGSR